MLRKYVKAGGTHFAVTEKKVFTLTAFALVLNATSVRQFLITSKRQVAAIISSAVLTVLYVKRNKAFQLCDRLNG